MHNKSSHMNIFYKTSVVLAIAICIASILQSHQLRSQIKELRSTIKQLENANSILDLDKKQCILDAKLNKSRYLLTEEDNKVTLWKLEEVIEKN
jgi:phage shock protein A